MTRRKTLLRRLFSPMLRAMRGRKGGRLFLVLRLENIELLEQHLGHGGFAHLLVQISMRMTQALRPHDPVQIAAPGIFSVLLRTDAEVEAMRIALRVQTSCQTQFRVNGMTITPVFSGVLAHAHADVVAQTPSQIVVENARERLAEFGPPQLGRILLIPYDGQGRRASQPATVAEAVAEGQIEAYFQPQICCNSGRIAGFEALARWNHPVRGLLLPGAFLPGMNDLDHAALTHQMLRQSLAALRRWDIEGWQVPTVALNISQPELSDNGFADMVFWELDRQNIAPSRLVLELLENVGPINSCDVARTNLVRLSQAGCQIDLDDFGTGYASLASIRHFGVNRIKIDRSFIAGCHKDSVQQRMILAILALAERLGIAALAEGVETVEENAFLAQIGMDHVQGYAIAPPMPLGRACDFIAGHQQKQGEITALLARKTG